MTKRRVGFGIAIGVLATLIMDQMNELVSGWKWIAHTDRRFLGRVAYQWAHGRFVHDSPKQLPTVPQEAIYGILYHYGIGIILALTFLFLSQRLWKRIEWRVAPIYGVLTTVFAWFWLFPSVGLGVAGHRAHGVNLALTSFVNHVFYGLGLAFGCWLVSKLEHFIDDSPFTVPNPSGGSRVVPGALYLSLSTGQAIASASMAIMFMMGSLLLVELSGGAAGWAGVPSALVLLAASVMAYPMGRYKDRNGYRPTLRVAWTLGICAGLVGALGASVQSRVLVMGACILAGLANGTILLSRFAAAEITVPSMRGKAMSVVMTGATLGAVGGPFLANAMEGLGSGLGLKKAAIPFAFAALLYLAGRFVTNRGFSVEPREVLPPAPAPAPPVGGRAVSAPKSQLYFGVGSLLFGQIAMVFVMAVTPVHMHAHHHSMSSISFVLIVHFFGMYGMSFLSGWLADKYGRRFVITSGSFLLMAACVVSLVSTGVAWAVAGLFLLGVGWNFCFISGTVLLSDFLKGPNRGRIQGFTDGLISLSSGASSLSSGVFLSAFGFKTLALIGLAFASVPLLLFLIFSRAPARAEEQKSALGAA
jgi:MFS family permease